MNKQAFLDALGKRLSGMPKDDIADRLAFYSEMIDDRMEEGCSEEEAVRAIGSVDDIAEEIISSIPLSRLAKERIRKSRRLSSLEIVLIILGAPIWLSLLIAAGAVVLSLYVSVWSVIVSLWAAEASVIGGAVGGAAAGILFLCTGNPINGLLLIGAALALAGLSIFLFYGCKAVTKGILYLTKKAVLGIKKCFVGRERAV